jgi:hypothetical protein
MTNPFEGTLDAYADAAPAAPPADPLARLVALTCEEVIFGLSAAPGNAGDALEGLMHRRGPAHHACVQGANLPTMDLAFDTFVVEMTRAITPICPPSWLPMSEVLAEKVTLEVGARGLRGLFTNKPSDKDVLRVRRFGVLAVRVLRAVYASDGPIDGEEARSIGALIASLGLPDAECAPLYAEPPIAIDCLDFQGEIEVGVQRALMRGAWLAAAQDAIDPREEGTLRVLANKLGITLQDFEMMRTEAIARVEARRMAGLAAVDAARFVLADRVPGPGVTLATRICTLMLARRHRDEALAHIAHGAPVVLAGRYRGISSEEKISALGMAWAAAQRENPTVSRLALVRARLERFARDLGEDTRRAREAVDGALRDALGAITANIP